MRILKIRTEKREIGNIGEGLAAKFLKKIGIEITDEEFEKFQNTDFVSEFSKLPYVLDKPATKEEIEDCIIDAIIGADVYQEPQQMRFDDVK